MNKTKKILIKVLNRCSDSNIKFDELCSLLEHLGFERRIKGSHNIFRKKGVIDKINLQKDGNMAKPYQVKQVRKTISENEIGGSNE